MNKYYFVLLSICLYFTDAIYVKPKQVSKWIGTPVTLYCDHRGDTDCAWLLNDKPINIPNSYRYRHYDRVYVDSTDCSIHIGLFHEEDVGNWTCWIKSTDTRDGHLLESYDLKLRTSQSDGYMLSQPRNVTAKLGDDITLPCHFSFGAEQCNWFRNNDSVFVSGRYQYLVGYSDCSLKIFNVQSVDAGTWQCTTSANDMYGYIFSKPAWVKVLDNHTSSPAKENVDQQPNSIEEQPQNVTTLIGTTTYLNCKFRQPVICVWFRKGRVIHVGHRYSYLKAEKDIKTTDCSMKISNVQMIDDGLWQCAQAADTTQASLTSIPAYLTLATYLIWVSITRHPQDVIVRHGSSANMTCTFNTTVSCSWRRNDKIVSIDGRYKYTNSNGSSTTDCSISISAINEVDIGNWQCENMLDYSNTSVAKTSASLTLAKAPTLPIIKLNGKEVTEVQLPMSQGTFMCMSTMGRPEPKLMWQLDGIDLFTILLTSRRDDSYYVNATTLISFSRILLQKRNPSSLKCFVHHPSFDTSPFAEVIFISPESVTQNPPVIKTHPQRKIVKDGDIIQLDCIFDRAVDCYWDFNGKIMPPNSYFKFINNSDGKNTTDCSISLSPFDDYLVGQWQCSTMATDKFPEIKSRKALLTQMKTPTGPVIKLNYVEVSEILLDDLDVQRDKLTCHSYKGVPIPSLEVILTSKGLGEASLTQSWGQSSYSEGGQFDVIVGITPTSNKTFIENISKYDSLTCILTHPTLEYPRYTEVDLKKIEDVAITNSTTESIPMWEKEFTTSVLDTHTIQITKTSQASTDELTFTTYAPHTQFDPSTKASDVTKNNATSALSNQNSMPLNTKYAAIGSSLFIVLLVLIGLGLAYYYRYKRNVNNDQSPNLITKYLRFKKNSESGNEQLIKYSEQAPENDDGIYF